MTLAEWMTAPIPVRAAQPNMAATSSGTSSSITTTDSRATTAYSENAETPRWGFTRSPDVVRRMASPCRRSPLPLDSAPRWHRAGRPLVQGRQFPHIGTKTRTPGHLSSHPGHEARWRPPSCCLLTRVTAAQLFIATKRFVTRKPQRWTQSL